jgi:anaerobic magnesium-protoporphyrin IX monomethyl ester cyclase
MVGEAYGKITIQVATDMNTRIMLINSLTMRNEYIGADNYFPLGLLYIATVAKNNNMDVVIEDINNYYYQKACEVNEDTLYEYFENHLSKNIKQYKPDIIGIGAIFSGAFRCLRIIAKCIKDRLPSMPIVIGGISATMFGREILEKYSYIDYVVIGEGESTFLALVNYLTGKMQSLESIGGIAYRKNGSVKLDPKTKYEDNLDALPLVDYSILNVKKYEMGTSEWYSPKKIKIGTPFPILSSRSCPYKCNFCNMWLVHGPSTRLRSSGNVLDEMENLYNNYNARYFQFVDDNLTFHKERMLELCNGILERKMDIQFDTPNGVAINRLDQDVIDAMVNAGLIKISIAIESGSEYIRNKVIGKGLENKKIYEVVDACTKHNHLYIKGFFVIGMPQETHETLEETYKMIKDLPLDNYGVFFATPYQGTKLFDYCLQHNLLPYKAEDYVDVDDLQLGSVRPHFKPHKLTEEDLIRFQKKCNEYLKKKREASNVPNNYPLRYRG